MSTEDSSSGAAAAPEDAPPFHPDRPYRLSPDVALRPEHFGALAYHFGTRQLSFLKSPQLVECVTNLHRHPSARSAVSHLPDADRPTYLRALAGLAGTRMIVPA